MSEEKLHFRCNTPCKSCPYRKDTPVKTWSIEEFKRLLETESDPLGVVYACHKKNGSVCIGWLIDQDKRYFPSIALRIKFSRENITRAYLDTLHSPVALYKSVREMIRANFPELVKRPRRSIKQVRKRYILNEKID